MTYIQVPDMNDSMMSITIDEVEYYLRFTYNEKYDFWNFGIYDEEKNAIVTMTKIVPSTPLLMYYKDKRLPDGNFGAISELSHIGRDDFKNINAEFVYIPNEEVKAYYGS